MVEQLKAKRLSELLKPNPNRSKIQKLNLAIDRILKSTKNEHNKTKKAN